MALRRPGVRIPLGPLELGIEGSITLDSASTGMPDLVKRAEQGLCRSSRSIASELVVRLTLQHHAQGILLGRPEGLLLPKILESWASRAPAQRANLQATG